MANRTLEREKAKEKSNASSSSSLKSFTSGDKKNINSITSGTHRSSSESYKKSFDTESQRAKPHLSSNDCNSSSTSEVLSTKGRSRSSSRDAFSRSIMTKSLDDDVLSTIKSQKSSYLGKL
jgi:hypothetical protein